MSGIISAVFGHPATVHLSLDEARHFHQGELVAGTISIDSPTHPIPEIILKFDGLSRTDFTIGKVRHTFGLILANKELSIKNVPSGKHKVPFKFQMPDTVVSTISADEGSVRYWIRASSAGFWLSGTIQIDIPVRQLIDTNHWLYNFEVAGKDEKTNCCCCCASGPISMEAKTDRAAYCQGEFVAVTADFTNNSNKSVTPYVIATQKIKFHGIGSAHKMDAEHINLNPVAGRQDSSIMRTLQPGESNRWQQVAFRLPAFINQLPSINCENIQVTYFFKVGLRVTMGFNAEVKLPIVIGTVPYNQPLGAVQQQPVTASSVMLDELAIMTGIVRWSGVGSNGQYKGKYQHGLPLLGPAMSPSDPAHVLLVKRVVQQTLLDTVRA